MASDYQVGNPQLQTEISDSGTGFTKAWEVPYTVTSGPAQGTKGAVRVPADQYSADAVHTLIRQAVDVHHEVMSQ